MQYILTEEEYQQIKEHHATEKRFMCLAFVGVAKRRCPMTERDGICNECEMDTFCGFNNKTYYENS